jgi:hypothetical protein
MDRFQIYVKPTSNCEGMPLQTFERLGPEWVGDSLILPFGPEGTEYEVVGWTDLFGGSPCQVHVVRVRHIPRGEEGYLVYGGNSGVRILDDEADPIPGVDDHLPRGYGMPIIWVEDVGDLPPDVRAVVES